MYIMVIMKYVRICKFSYFKDLLFLFFFGGRSPLEYLVKEGRMGEIIRLTRTCGFSTSQAWSTTLTSMMTTSSRTWTHPMIMSLWCTMRLSHLTRMIVSLRSQPRSLSLTPLLGSAWISVPLIWRDWTECTIAVSTSGSEDWVNGSRQIPPSPADFKSIFLYSSFMV